MPCIDMIGTGGNIAAMCKAHGMTMTQMADRIGVTPVAVSKWKTGRNIAAMCKAHGMTMTQIADRIGVTPVAVSKWKTGRNMPTIDNFIAMAGIFGVKVDDIIRIRII